MIKRQFMEELRSSRGNGITGSDSGEHELL